jgi:membrane protein insertase Oxa1/YidC/SpoIIIJ
MSWRKFSKDPMKKQQETMKLYNKAGVNPMGCIPTDASTYILCFISILSFGNKFETKRISLGR